MATGNGAVRVFNPFVSQGELRRPLLRHAALRAVIAIVYRLYVRGDLPRLVPRAAPAFHE